MTESERMPHLTVYTVNWQPATYRDVVVELTPEGYLTMHRAHRLVAAYAPGAWAFMEAGTTS